jgi:hypothetical protein
VFSVILNEVLMRQIIIAILSTILATGAGAVAAADWELLAVAPEEAMLIDRDSIHSDGDLWKAWAVKSYKETTYLAHSLVPHRSRVLLYEMDCRRGELGYAAWSFQSGELGGGVTVWADRAQGKVAFFAPDENSPEATLLAHICGPVVVQDADRPSSGLAGYRAQR